MASTQLWGEEKSENRICSRSDDRSKVTAQGEVGGSNPKLGAYFQFLTETRRFEAFVDVRRRFRGGERVSAASQARWSLGELHSPEIPRKSATRLVGEEG